MPSSLRTLLLAGLFALVACLQAQTTVAPTLTLTDEERVYELRLSRILGKKGRDALLDQLRQDLKDNPKPWVKAWYASYVVYAHQYGNKPLTDIETGWRLVHEAKQEGSVYAHMLAGRGLIDGLIPGQPKDAEEGARLVILAAETGHHTSMTIASHCLFFGVGVWQDRIAAEKWVYRAAFGNATLGLCELARHTEEGVYVKPADPAKACAHYFEAAWHGSPHARRHLAELAEKGNLAAQRAQHLLPLRHIPVGAEFPNPKIRGHIKWLEEHFPDDPQVQTIIAVVLLDKTWHVYDPKKAKTLLDRASAAGWDDAKFWLARMQLFGIGGKKDTAAALPELSALAERGNARALAQLGWAYYWGPWKELGLTKDAEKSFLYSKQAADLGDWYGQLNTGMCYEHGIGTTQNYHLAVWYYSLAAGRGSAEAKEKERRLLAHLD